MGLCCSHLAQVQAATVKTPAAGAAALKAAAGPPPPGSIPLALHTGSAINATCSRTDGCTKADNHSGRCSNISISSDRIETCGSHLFPFLVVPFCLVSSNCLVFNNGWAGSCSICSMTHCAAQPSQVNSHGIRNETKAAPVSVWMSIDYAIRGHCSKVGQVGHRRFLLPFDTQMQQIRARSVSIDWTWWDTCLAVCRHSISGRTP